jgi:hypothetical protein
MNGATAPTTKKLRKITNTKSVRSKLTVSSTRGGARSRVSGNCRVNAPGGVLEG